MTPSLALAGRAAAALLLTLSAGAARGEDGFECPAKGGREWREVRSEHFVLVTDLSSRKARALSRELETIHRAVQKALFRNPPPAPGLVRVVAFSRREEFKTFVPRQADGIYQRVRGEPTMVIPGALAEAQRFVLAHELAHHLLGRLFARQPRWFSEGVACFVESVGLSGPDSPPTVGGMPPHRHASVYPYFGGAAAVLLEKGPLADVRAYGIAWALVHYLMNVRSDDFAVLQGRLQRGDDPDAAFREVFPEYDPATPQGAKAIDRDLGKYLGTGRFGYRDLKLEKDHPEPAERRLSASEVHALRLALPRHGDRDGAQFEAELREAVAEEPGNVVALEVLAARTPAEGRALAARATAAHPEDVRAWLFLGAASEGPEREAALRKAAEVGPEHAGALNELSWHLIETEREGEAIPLAVRAAQLAPWDGAILDTLAAALQGVGRCDEALVVQRRALDVLPEQAGDAPRAALGERLSALERACGPARTAPAAAAKPGAGGAKPAP